MFGKLVDKATSLYAWAVRHRVISVVVVLAAAVMFINIFSGASESVNSEQDLDRSEVAALETTIYGFIDAYGCWSYLDASDTADLARYAHADLVKDLAAERISPYLLPGEGSDPEAARGIAAARMQQLGAVKVARVEEVEVLEHSGEAFQVQLSVTEFTFSGQEGLAEAEATYTLDIEKAAGAGISSPYQVVRFLKD